MIHHEAWYREAAGEKDLQRLLRTLGEGDDLLQVAILIGRQGTKGLTPDQHERLLRKINGVVSGGNRDPRLIEALLDLAQGEDHFIDTTGIPLSQLPKDEVEKSLRVLEKKLASTVTPQDINEAWNLALHLGRWPDISLEVLEQSDSILVPKVKWSWSYDTVSFEGNQIDTAPLYSGRHNNVSIPVSEAFKAVYAEDTDWEIVPGDSLVQSLTEVDSDGVEHYLRAHFTNLSGATKEQFFRWMVEAGQKYGGDEPEENDEFEILEVEE